MIFYKEFEKRIDTFEGALNIQEFNEFVNRNLSVMINDKDKQFKFYELSILTAINDGVSILDICLDYKTVYKLFDNSVENYTNKLKEKYRMKINLNFDLGISRKSYKKQDNMLIKELIDSRVFNGIDLYGDELIFGKSLFEEYLILYKNDIFNINELYNILKNGFNNYDYSEIGDIKK